MNSNRKKRKDYTRLESEDLIERRPEDSEGSHGCDWHDILLICNTAGVVCIAFLVVIILVLVILNMLP